VDEVLRAALLERLAAGHRAFAEVERMMATDDGFAREVTARAAGGCPLVLLDWPDAPEPFRRMVAVDIENSRWLADLISSVGWPGH
jgi:hypothetical protein